MPRLTKFIYATIGLWLATTLLIYAIGDSEAIQGLRGFWPLLSLFPAAILTLLCLIAFFVDNPRLWAAWAIFLVALTTVTVFKTFGSWGAWIHFQIYKNRYEMIARQSRRHHPKKRERRYALALAGFTLPNRRVSPFITLTASSTGTILSTIRPARWRDRISTTDISLQLTT